MPLPEFQGRGTLFFSNNQSGWSESYFFNSLSYADCATALISIANARLDFLHTSISINHAYVSNIVVRGDAILVPAALGDGTFVDTDGYVGLDYALLATFSVGVFSRNRTFLRGLPIGQQTDGFYTPTTPFSTAVTAWVAQVLESCVFRQRVPNPDTPPPPTVIQYNPPSRCTLSPQLARRKTGRPFGLPRGRLIAP